MMSRVELSWKQRQQGQTRNLPEHCIEVVDIVRQDVERTRVIKYIVE